MEPHICRPDFLVRSVPSKNSLETLGQTKKSVTDCLSIAVALIVNSQILYSFLWDKSCQNLQLTPLIHKIVHKSRTQMYNFHKNSPNVSSFKNKVCFRQKKKKKIADLINVYD